MTRTGRGRAGLVPTVVLLLAGLTACGGAEAPPGERVPVLAEQVDRVDAAVAEGRYDEARAAVESLVGETAQAQVAGDLDGDEAQRILDAARVLLERLPETADDRPDPGTGPEEPEETVEPEEPVQPTDPFEPAESEGDPDEKDEKDDEKQEKEQEKDEKEKDEDEGNGG